MGNRVQKRSRGACGGVKSCVWAQRAISDAIGFDPKPDSLGFCFGSAYKLCILILFFFLSRVLNN